MAEKEEILEWIKDVNHAREKLGEGIRASTLERPDPVKLRECADWAEELIGAQQTLGRLCAKYLPAILDASEVRPLTALEHHAETLVAQRVRDELAAAKKLAARIIASGILDPDASGAHAEIVDSLIALAGRE